MRLVAVAPISVDTIQGDPPLRLLGGAVYSALAASRWGHVGAVLGPVGEDEVEGVRTRLSGASVDTSGLIVGPWPTRRVVIDESAEVLEQTTWVDAMGDLPAYDAPAIGRRLRAADVVLAYGHAPALGEAALAGAPHASLTAVDLQDVDDPAVARGLAARAAWTMVSWPSARALTGVGATRDVHAGLRALGATHVVMKLGPGGSLVCTADGACHEIPTWLGPYHRTVGAGDVFNAVFLMEVASGRPVAAAAWAAGQAAAVHVAGGDASDDDAGGRGDGERPPRLPGVPTRAVVEQLAGGRVPAFSLPEMRGAFQVVLAAPTSTNAERRYTARLGAAVAGHGFHCVPVSPAADASAEAFVADVLTRAERADLAVVVLDGGDPRLAASAHALVDAGAPTVLFESNARRSEGVQLPAGARARTDVLTADGESQLVAALYAWAGGGRSAATALAACFARAGQASDPAPPHRAPSG